MPQDFQSMYMLSGDLDARLAKGCENFYDDDVIKYKEDKLPFYLWNGSGDPLKYSDVFPNRRLPNSLAECLENRSREARNRTLFLWYCSMWWNCFLLGLLRYISRFGSQLAEAGSHLQSYVAILG